MIFLSPSWCWQLFYCSTGQVQVQMQIPEPCWEQSVPHFSGTIGTTRHVIKQFLLWMNNWAASVGRPLKNHVAECFLRHLWKPSHLESIPHTEPTLLFLSACFNCSFHGCASAEWGGNSAGDRKAVIIFKVEHDSEIRKEVTGQVFCWVFFCVRVLSISFWGCQKESQNTFMLGPWIKWWNSLKVTATPLTSRMLWVSPIPKYSSLGRKYPSAICSQSQRPQQRRAFTSRRQFFIKKKKSN